MGIILPGRPIANVCFKTYGYISMAQAVFFLNDFKLGHYMKIPPRSMFLVQVLFTAPNHLIPFINHAKSKPTKLNIDPLTYLVLLMRTTYKQLLISSNKYFTMNFWYHIHSK